MCRKIHCYVWEADFHSLILLTDSNHLIKDNILLSCKYCYIYFFNCHLAAPRPTLGHYRGSSLTHPMLITCVFHIQHEGYCEPRNEVGSLSPAEHLVGFERGIFWFWSQHLNPLGHFVVQLMLIPTNAQQYLLFSNHMNKFDQV